MNVEDAPKLSMRNMDRLRAAGEGGCYACLKRVFSADVCVRVDNGETAVCPYCDIDALLPGVTDSATLNAAHNRWFSRKRRA
jgi:hypothetical protein